MFELSLLRPRFDRDTRPWHDVSSTRCKNLTSFELPSRLALGLNNVPPSSRCDRLRCWWFSSWGWPWCQAQLPGPSCHFAGRYRTSWRLCWTGWWEFRERAKQNGDVSVFVKCYTICSKAASKRAHCQPPRFVWVTPSLIHWSAVDCKRVNLSPVFCCRVAMHRIDHETLHAQSPLWHPSSAHFPYLSLID